MPESSGYTRICELAKGGMGRVDLAARRDGPFRRLYAIKRLRESYRDDPEFRAMFLDEARIAGFLRHPNVVSVVDVGEDEDGPFLVLDYVEGVSLGDMIVRATEQGREVPLSIALRIGVQVTEGLHSAHELRDPQNGEAMQLVHRDVSPQNVLLGYDGAARVTDFGIAKAFGRLAKTHTGVLKGKMGYMAPEVLRFEEPDRRSDLFAFGVVLFEMLTGKRLYKNVDGMDGTRRILNEPPPDLGEHRDDAPPELVELMFRLLAKDATHRPSTALEVARALETVLADVLADAPPIELGDYLGELFAERRADQEARIRQALEATEDRANLVVTPSPPRSRRLLLFGLIGAAVLGSAALAAVALTREEPPPDPSPNAGVVPDVTFELAEPVIENVPAEPVAIETMDEAPATPMRRRPRGMKTTKMSGASMGATPMWGWQ